MRAASMSRLAAPAALLLATAPLGPLAAQTNAPPTAGGRFTMHPVDGGVLRLDTDTGGMSMCKSGTGGQWSCQALPDERAALEKEIARLSNDNKDLQSAVKRLENLAGLPPEKRDNPGDKGIDPLPGPGGPLGKVPLPSEEDIDRAMGYLRGMVKKFKDELKKFEDLDEKRTERL